MGEEERADLLTEGIQCHESKMSFNSLRIHLMYFKTFYGFLHKVLEYNLVDLFPHKIYHFCCYSKSHFRKLHIFSPFAAGVWKYSCC